jgi:uncharacterized sulfatase
MPTELTRRSFLAAGAAVATMPFVRAAAAPRNVLFIASDDLNTCLSAYGHPIVRTPNIDRIAARGVVFQRAYCQNPWCGPSRASLMTGLSPDSVGVHDLTTHFRTNLPDVVTLPQLFQKNGYFTGRVGKIYHYGVPGQIGTDGLDDRPSWRQVVNPNGVDHTTEEPLLTNFTPSRGLGSAVAFHASSAPDEAHTDGIGAAAAVDMIAQHRREPFFVGMGFYRPHCPYVAPAKYFDRIPLDRIPPPPFDEAELRQAPEWAYFTSPANWGMSVQQQREAIRAYYASIEFLDAQVGKVLDALDRLGIAENTVIVFWGDNGYQLGEHGQWMKQTVFERSARVPLLIGGAGVKARGQVCPRTVELLDLYPTLADVCSLRGAPRTLQGRSLIPLLGNASARWEKPAVSQVRRTAPPAARARAGESGSSPAGAPPIYGYSIRTERYRYSQWERDGVLGEELYDYEADPREVRNLAADPAAGSIKSRLRQQLAAIRRLRPPLEAAAR